MKIFTPFNFERFPLDGDIKNEYKLEYIKAMISLAQSDKKAVFPYVVVALAIMGFMVNKYDQVIFTSSLEYKLLFYFGLILLIFYSILFFTYWRKIHKCEIRITNCIPTLNIYKAQLLWEDLWNNNKLVFKFGLLFLIVGTLITILVPLILRSF